MPPSPAQAKPTAFHGLGGPTLWRALVPTCLLLLLGVVGAASAETTATAAGIPPATSLKAGATLRLDFPELAPDRQGRMTACVLSLPTGYDPAKKFPLVVWLAGGEGDHLPSRAFLPPGDHVAAGLPYPKGAVNPAQASMVGDFATIWSYHRAMLDEIHRQVPNLDRRRSVLAGFSNGAHAMDGMLRLAGNGPRLTDYFGAFVFADGGGTAYTARDGLPPLTGLPAYVCWGEKSPNKLTSSRLARELRSAGALVTADETTGGGHAFGAEDHRRVAAWLTETARPAPSPEAR